MHLPRVIDRYELAAVLGTGGFATVYRGRHVHTHQVVALKLLEPTRGSTERFIAEARAAAAVQHRNVVRVLDCGHAGVDVFIVMELVDGQTLAEVLRMGPLAPQRAVGIAIQILDGLAAAHARGIVHRDIKPPNILLARDSDGTELPKILDFGVSKELTGISGTLDGTAIGTPGYMAPELFGGAKHADARADVYAVGATLYEMLSGRLPFPGTVYEELVVQVATRRPAPLLDVAPHVPLPVAAAVDRALARDREARWQSAEQFAAVLRGGLLGLTPPSSHQFEPTIDARYVPNTASEQSTLRTAAPPVVNTPQTAPAHGRARNVAGMIAAAALVASVGGGLIFYRRMNAATAPIVSAPVAATQHSQSLEGVHFKEPKIVGTAQQSAVVALEKYITPKVQRCRPDGDKPTVARVDLFIASEGTINMAHPTPNDPGDTVTSSCLAAAFKAAATPATFAPNGSGVATVEATFDPR